MKLSKKQFNLITRIMTNIKLHKINDTTYIKTITLKQFIINILLFLQTLIGIPIGIIIAIVLLTIELLKDFPEAILELYKSFKSISPICIVKIKEDMNEHK